MSDETKEEDTPLDQRVREAEQYSEYFSGTPPQPFPPDSGICIGDCKVCQYCDGD